jgi:predicted nucleic acid-binding protein
LPYADTDFFVALIGENDRLRKRAEELYNKHKGKIWTSVVTVLEIVLVAKRRGASIERVVRDFLELSEVRGVSRSSLMEAAHYIDEEHVSIFDAFHAALTQGDEIISSDEIYDHLGIPRIRL